MALWCICYDLLAEPLPQAASGIRGLLPAISEAVASLGPSVQVSPSACLLACDLSADQIMDQLYPQVINTRERIVILPITAGMSWRTHSGAADDPVIGWIVEHLGN